MSYIKETLTAYTSTAKIESEDYYLREIAFYALKLAKKKWYQNMDYEKRRLAQNCDDLNTYYWTEFYK